MVIAILAAISVVAYNGIQTRAYNVAVISQAKQVVDLVNAYVAVEGKYPSTDSVCATKDNQCTWADTTVSQASNAGLMQNLETIGTPPASRVSGDAAGRYGVRLGYYNNPSRTWNGILQPVVIVYYLKGTNQNCNIANVMNSNQNGPSTTGNSGSGDGHTACWIHIDGPTS